MTHQVPRTLAIAAGLALTFGAALTVPAAATDGTSAVSVHHIKVAGAPDQVAIDHQTRSVWVAAGRLVRISEVTRRVTASIPIRPGVRLVATDPRTRIVWATSCLTNCSLVEVSEASNRVLHRVGGFRDASGLGVDPQRGLVWVAGLNSLDAVEVLAISEVKHRIVRTIVLHVDSHHQPGSLAVNPSTGTVWVAVIPADPSVTTCSISEISESTHRVVHVYPGACQTSAITAFDSSRGTAWLDFGSFRQGGRLEVVNIARHKVVRAFPGTMAAPDGLAIDSRTRTVVATGGAGGGHQDTVLLISESSGNVTSVIPVGVFPSLPALDRTTGEVYVPIVLRDVVLQFRI